MAKKVERRDTEEAGTEDEMTGRKKVGVKDKQRSKGEN